MIEACIYSLYDTYMLFHVRNMRIFMLLWKTYENQLLIYKTLTSSEKLTNLDDSIKESYKFERRIWMQTVFF